MKDRFFKRIYVEQIEENDCGIACLLMIFKFYGSNVPISKLREAAKTQKDGTTVLGLAKAAEKYKFEVKAFKADMSLFSKKGLPCPFMIHVKKSDGVMHYYNILKADSKGAVISDPDPNEKIKRISYQELASEWTGIVIFITPSLEYRPIKEKNPSLWDFVPSILKNKGLIFKVILLSLVSTTISILGSYFLQFIINTIVPSKSFNVLTTIILCLIMGYLIQGVCSFSKDYFLSYIGKNLSIEILLKYIKHIFNLPIEFYENRKTGDITSRFNDANKIIDALSSTIVSLFLDLIMFLAISVALVIQSYKLFLITISIIPFYVLTILGFSKKFRKLNQIAMESSAKLNSNIIEDIHGIETIKAMNCEKIRINNTSKKFDSFLNNNIEYIKLNGLQNALKSLMYNILTVVILGVGVKMVINSVLSLGQLVTYNVLLSFLFSPLQSIINLQPKIESAITANNRLNEIYNVESEFLKSKKNMKSLNLEGDIELKNVSYSYGYKNNILTDIDLIIKQNEKIALVGASGAGKSTLAKLLVNYYPVFKGKILFNGTNIDDIDKHILRSHICYLPQQPYIFSGTIKDNLLLGIDKKVSMDNVIEICKDVGIYNDIKKMPLGLLTVLDENGDPLSEGQKQRVALARALLTTAKVLILDESTSNVDPINEKRIIKKILNSDRTIIFIAHHLSITKDVDKIVVLNQGKIVEEGNYEELVHKKQCFYRLIKD